MSTGTTQHSSSCSADSPQSFTSQTSIILSQCQDNFTSAVQNTDVDPVKSIPNEVVLPSIDILIQCLPIEKQSVLFPPHPEQVFPTYFQQQSLHQQVHFSDSTKSRDTSFVLCQQAQTLASVHRKLKQKHQELLQHLHNHQGIAKKDVERYSRFLTDVDTSLYDAQVHYLQPEGLRGVAQARPPHLRS